MNSKKRQKLEALAGQRKDNTNLLFNLARQREQRKANNPHLYTSNPYSVKNMHKPQSAASVDSQLKNYRMICHFLN